jgi:hypothetical protein
MRISLNRFTFMGASELEDSFAVLQTPILLISLRISDGDGFNAVGS